MAPCGDYGMMCSLTGAREAIGYARFPVIPTQVGHQSQASLGPIALPATPPHRIPRAILLSEAPAGQHRGFRMGPGPMEHREHLMWYMPSRAVQWLISTDTRGMKR